MNRHTLLGGALLASSCLSTPAFAQAIYTAAPLHRVQIDENGVDRATGNVTITATELSIGPDGPGGLSVVGYHETGAITGQSQNWDLVLYASGQTYTAGLGLTGATFIRSGNNFTSASGDGSTLTVSGSTYTYTSHDGVKIIYDFTTIPTGEAGVVARATKLIYPNGDFVTLTWENVTYCTNSLDGCLHGTFQTRVRLDYVTNSSGYQLSYFYAEFDKPTSAADGAKWNNLKSIVGVNLAAPDCTRTGATCASSSIWPIVYYSLTQTFTSNTTTITNGVIDSLGRVARYTDVISSAGGQVFSIKRPSSSTDNIVYNYDTSNKLYQIARDGQLYSYTNSISGNILTISVTDPLSHISSTTADTNIQQILTSTNGLLKTTTYTYDASGLIPTFGARA